LAAWAELAGLGEDEAEGEVVAVPWPATHVQGTDTTPLLQVKVAM